MKTILTIVLFELCLMARYAQANPIDCTQATVVSAPNATVPEQTAITVLLQETARRTGRNWQSSQFLPLAQRPGCRIIAATESNLLALLPPALQRFKRNTPEQPESFSVHTLAFEGRQTIFITGHDPRGLLYALGYLLRTMELSRGKALLPRKIDIQQSPQKPIRG